MAVAQLVLAYITTLAWPLVVFVAFFMLKDELRGLLGRITSASFAGITLELEQEAADVLRRTAAATGKSLSDEPVPSLPGLPGRRGVMRPRVNTRPHPATAVDLAAFSQLTRSWSELEDASVQAVKRRSPDATIVPNVERNFRELARHGAVNADLVNAAGDVQNLRNRIIHSTTGEITESTVGNFQRTIDLLQTVLEGL